MREEGEPLGEPGDEARAGRRFGVMAESSNGDLTLSCGMISPEDIGAADTDGGTTLGGKLCQQNKSF